MRSLVLLSLAVLAGCGDSAPTSPAGAPETSDLTAQVEAAVRKHLARRSDLDMTAMDLSIERVNVQGDEADATVDFRVKDSPEAAMSMDYHLVKEAGAWVVQPNAAGHGVRPSQQGLPPGHPPGGGEQPPQPLPPGHPPVAQ